MFNQFCYTQLTGEKCGAGGAGRGGGKEPVDDEACITTLANIFYRTIYYQEAV